MILLSVHGPSICLICERWEMNCPEKDSHRFVYAADPMCSWCWGFHPVIIKVRERFQADMEFEMVLGGLAPDSDEPMPEPVQKTIEGFWRVVADRTGANFNHEFWTKNTPKRSTYPSCRAVIAAGQSDRKWEYFEAAQKAYYMEARNPSEQAVLVDIAEEIGIDRKDFEGRFTSEEVAVEFQRDLTFCRQIGISGFPTLLFGSEDGYSIVCHGYTPFEPVMERIESLMAGDLT